MTRRARLAPVPWALVCIAAASAPAFADDEWPAPVDETWRTECGASPVPNPPGRLPARSWRAVVEGLSRHFGTDASLEPQAAAEVAAFLEQHAGRDRGGPTLLRVTETR